MEKITRAIVVSLDEAKVLLKAIDMRRKYIQDNRKDTLKSSCIFIHETSALADVEKRLLEVKAHMDVEESYWDEKMREYMRPDIEESSDTEMEAER